MARKPKCMNCGRTLEDLGSEGWYCWYCNKFSHGKDGKTYIPGENDDYWPDPDDSGDDKPDICRACDNPNYPKCEESCDRI